MEPAPPEKILEAFKTLDLENKGYLTKENFGKLMMEEGEPFTQEEMDEMWPVAIDPISGHIPYELYLNQLMVRAKMEMIPEEILNTILIPSIFLIFSGISLRTFEEKPKKKKLLIKL